MSAPLTADEIEAKVLILERQIIRLTIAMAAIGGSLEVSAEKVKSALDGSSDGDWKAAK